MEISDTFQITLKVGTTTFPITIRRDEELYYRNAEKLINQKFSYYANHYPRQENETYLMMATLDIAVTLQKAEATGNLKPVMGILEELVTEVEGALK
ncbi:MAG: cell division protein ZapA [Bacteroidaceae bacterium]|jgi:cell division protein ZapA|nr:cell division protein ZapA [Bacteroidaceae bacterium]MBR4243342.1 cell division protein ZapA [Bacteroidaceae bacterium]